MPPSAPSSPPQTLEALAAELAREQAARRQIEEEAAVMRQQLERVSALASRARRLAEHLPMGVLLTDPGGRILLATENVYRLLDLPGPTPAVVGERFSVLVRRVMGRFAQPAEVRAWSRIIPRGAVPVRNLQLTRADARVLEIDAQPLAEPEGGGWLLVLRDVTARESARRDVAEQRAFYETILDNLPSDVAVLDADHRYLFVNPAAVADPSIRQWITGRTDAEYCHYRRRPPEMAEQRFALFEEAARERRVLTWEEELPGADGTLRTLRRHLQPVFDSTTGALRLMIGYGFDVTALRAAQRAVDEQRTFYETVLDNLPADVAVFDAALRYRYLNPHAQPDPTLRQWVVGHTWQEYVAHAHVAPERVEQREQVFAQALATRSLVSWDEALPHPDTGAPRILRRHLRPLFHADGAPYLLIGYGVDITLVREAQRAAEEAARTRENFLANMSHEIRTPLNGVLGMVALLAKTPLSVTQHEYLEIVGASGRHLLGLLNDVLDMAKINSGHLDLECAPFRIADTLRAVTQNVVFRAAEQEATLLVESGGIVALEGVMGDDYRLQQVLLNLLTNALKFAPGGHVTLSARVLTETDAAVRVRFSVRDTGLGIPTDRQEAIFEEFTQAYTDTTRRFGGTGLGLAISQRLVGRMGGHLTVSSTPGEGATFAFTLLLARASTELAESAAGDVSALLAGPTPLPRLDGRHVLLVEDQEVNRLLARLLLESNGATVHEAASGPQALEWLAAHPVPDVVLMDIQMPGMSGLDVTRHIRALPEPTRAAVPIVALTANAFRADVERYLAAGMNACLTKPFEEVELVGLVAALGGPATVPPPASAAEPVPMSELPASTDFPPATIPSAYPATLLRVGRGDAAFARRIIGSFCAGGLAALVALRQAATTGDSAAAADVAHRLAPSVRLFDASELADTLTAIEHLPAADPSWNDALAFAEQELTALLSRLESMLATDDLL